LALFRLDQLFSYQDANEIKKFWAGTAEPTDYEEGEIWLDIYSNPPILKRCKGKDAQGNYMWDIIGEVTPSSMLTKIKTVDGAGSGLDADLLDGNEGSHYLNPDNLSKAVPKEKLPAEALRTDTAKDVSADIEWQDNYQAKFGNDGDLKIYHNGTHSYIDSSTGYLVFRNLKAGENTYIQATPTSGSLKNFFYVAPDLNAVFIPQDIPLYFGTSGQFGLYYNSTLGKGVLFANSGLLEINNFSNGNNIQFKCRDNSGTSKNLLTLDPNTNGAVMEGMLNYGNPDSTGGTLTISNGSITITRSYHKIDTEGAAVTDELTTINGGHVGDILILQSTSSSRDITLKQLDPGGNLKIGSDIILDHIRDKVLLIAIDNGGTLEWNAIGARSNAT